MNIKTPSISSLSSNITKPVTPTPSNNPQASEYKRIEKITQNVFEKKNNARKNYLHSRHKNMEEWLMISSDGFTSAYIGFLLVEDIAPTLTTLQSVAVAGKVLGVAGGIFNLAGGIACLISGIKLIKNGEALKGYALLINGALNIALSFVMTASSLGLMAFPPVVLTSLLFLASFPLFFEIGKRLKNIYTKKDDGSKMQFKKAKEILEQGNKDLNKVRSDLLKLFEHKDNPLCLSNFLIHSYEPILVKIIKEKAKNEKIKLILQN